jgi:hypothetical protein
LVKRFPTATCFSEQLAADQVGLTLVALEANPESPDGRQVRVAVSRRIAQQGSHRSK